LFQVIFGSDFNIQNIKWTMQKKKQNMIFKKNYVKCEVMKIMWKCSLITFIVITSTKYTLNAIESAYNNLVNKPRGSQISHKGSNILARLNRIPNTLSQRESIKCHKNWRKSKQFFVKVSKVFFILLRACSSKFRHC
jgi:type III secretory pathway component EscV